MKLSLVRFREAIHIGKALDLNSSLADGQKVLGDVVTLHYHDANFLRVDFESGYSTLIPWAQVTTVFYESTSDNAGSKRAKGGIKAAP